MKKIIIFLIFAFIKADFMEFKLDINSSISCVKNQKNEIFIGTDAGEIFQIYDKNRTKLIKNFDKVDTFFGDKQNAKIFDLDIFDSKILVLVSGNFGKKNLVILDKTEQIFEISDSFIKAKFLDDKFLVLANLSGEIYIFDIKNKMYKLIFNTLNSAIGDFSINENFGILGLESGEVIKIDFSNFSIKNYLNHKDKVFNVRLDKNGFISGGADRKVFLNNKEFKSDFLVYCVAIKDDLAAFCSENGVILIDKEVKNLGGKSSEFLEFLDKNLIFGANGNRIFYWSF